MGLSKWIDKIRKRNRLKRDIESLHRDILYFAKAAYKSGNEAMNIGLSELAVKKLKEISDKEKQLEELT